MTNLLKDWILSASALTAAVLVLRFLFRRRISQRLMYALWLPVLLRFLLPISLYSAPVSVPEAAERLAPAVFASPVPTAPADVPMVTAGPGVTAGPLSPAPAASAPPVSAAPVAAPTPAAEPAPAPSPAPKPLDWGRLLAVLWFAGAAAMALWMLGVNLAFRNKLSQSRTLLREGRTPVYVSEAVASPCLFGLLRPAVYLTPGAAALEGERLEQVLMHENMHRKQLDHVWGLLRCLCLAVWWWNPLVWLAAVCSRRDGELSCDERVLRTLGEAQRLDYGHTLVDLAPQKTPGALLCAATISGGGKALKERLERIVKKPKLWLAAAVAAVVLAALIVGCSFAGKGEDPGTPPAADISDGTRSAVFRLDRDGYREDLHFTVTWKDGRAEPKPRQGKALLRVKDTNTFVLEHELNLYLLDFERETLSAFLPEDIDRIRWADIQAEEETWDNKSRWAAAPAMSPNGSLLLYQTDRDSIGVRLYDFDTRKDRWLAPGFATAGGVVWNGETSVVLRGQNASLNPALYEITLADGEVRPLTELYALDWTGSYPWLLCAPEAGSFTCLNAETGRKLTLPLAGELLRFTLNGNTAGVLAQREGEYTLSAYTLGEASARQLLTFTPSPSSGASLEWTEEGRLLLTYTDAATGQTERCELDPAGGPPVDLGGEKFNQPVTAEMGSAWLSLPEGAVWLTEEELKDWEAWFHADWMRGQFLNSAYDKPQDVDLKQLFYDGVDTRGLSRERYESNLNPVLGEDVGRILARLGYWPWETDTVKLPKAQMETVLQKYLGLGLGETRYIGFDAPYIPETEAFYLARGDTNRRPDPQFLYGYRLGEEVCLFHDCVMTSGSGRADVSGVYRVELRETGEEKSFVSHMLAVTDGTRGRLEASLPVSAYTPRYGGDYGRDITVLTPEQVTDEELLGFNPRRQWSWSALDIRGERYGELFYQENDAGETRLVLDALGPNSFILPLPETAEGPVYWDKQGAEGGPAWGYSLGNGTGDGSAFNLLAGSVPDLAFWWMYCPEETDLGGGLSRQGGWVYWTLYLPKMQVYVYFLPDGAEPETAWQPTEGWQTAYRTLLQSIVNDDTPYVSWASGPAQGFELLDLSGNGTPELVIYLPGAGMSAAAVVVTWEEGELRCLNRDNSLGLPPSVNAVDLSAFYANPSSYDVPGNEESAFFRYYYTELHHRGEETGQIREGFYLLNATNGTADARWCTWYRFGQDGQGCLTCESVFSTDLRWEDDAAGNTETAWVLNGQEVTCYEYHVRLDSFWRNLQDYALLPADPDCCVVFRKAADPRAAADAALEAWSPLPASVPVLTPADDPGEWLDRLFSGGEKPIQMTLMTTDGGYKTLDLPGEQNPTLRYLLDTCTWSASDTGEASGEASKYKLTLRGGGVTLDLYQGQAMAVFRAQGEERILYASAAMVYPGSNGSAADHVRRQIFDPLECNMAVDAVRVEPWEYRTALTYVQRYCEAMKGLLPGNTWGIQDYEIGGIAYQSREPREPFALHTLIYLLPNEWNSLVWWAGAGLEAGTGDYEGWLIEDIYFKLELKNGVWRRTDSARFPASWAQGLELDLEPAPASETEPGTDAEVAPFLPVSESMGTDWLFLPEGARLLTEEELAEWQAWFGADWMRWQFLNSVYAKPQDVDLRELLYLGVDVGLSSSYSYVHPIIDEDIRYSLLHMGTWVTACPTDKLPRNEVDGLLGRYLGLGLEETNKVGLSYYYLPETDCFYHAHGDTNYCPRTFFCGYTLGEEVCLFYSGHRVTLEVLGENVRFRSNLAVLVSGRDVVYETPVPAPGVEVNYAGDYGRDVTVVSAAAVEDFESYEAAQAAIDAIDFTWKVYDDPEDPEAYREEVVDSFHRLLELDIPGYGALVYGELGTGTPHGNKAYLFFVTEGGRRYEFSTAGAGLGDFRMTDWEGAEAGLGFFPPQYMGSGLVSWWTNCVYETRIGGGETRQGGRCTWTLYLPTMELFACFRPEE